MYELLYISVAPQGLSESELMNVLKEARVKNQKLGITGMLVYHKREIMQILEGEKDIVKELFQTIQADDRHTSVEVFYEGEIEARAFAEWSMAFKLLDDSALETIMLGYEDFSKGESPIHMLSESPNRGKDTFLRLRDTL